MHKAHRNAPLTARQKQANVLISRRRYIVEPCFGTAKRLFGMTRASYLAAHKVNAQIILKGICMNLLKAANKIFILDSEVFNLKNYEGRVKNKSRTVIAAHQSYKIGLT